MSRAGSERDESKNLNAGGHPGNYDALLFSQSFVVPLLDLEDSKNPLAEGKTGAKEIDSDPDCDRGSRQRFVDAVTAIGTAAQSEKTETERVLGLRQAELKAEVATHYGRAKKRCKDHPFFCMAVPTASLFVVLLALTAQYIFDNAPGPVSLTGTTTAQMAALAAGQLATDNYVKGPLLKGLLAGGCLIVLGVLVLFDRYEEYFTRRPTRQTTADLRTQLLSAERKIEELQEVVRHIPVPKRFISSTEQGIFTPAASGFLNTSYGHGGVVAGAAAAAAKARKQKRHDKDDSSSDDEGKRFQ